MAESKKIDATAAFQEAPRQVSEFRRIVGVFFRRSVAVLGLSLILIVLLAAIFAPWLAPYDPYQMSMDNLQGTSLRHLLGTDELGRDLLSRIIYGSRVSLMIGLSVVAVSGVIGYFLGMMAAFFGGTTYMIIMRATDTMMAFPQILLFLLIAALLGGGFINVLIALTVGMLPGHIRMMCGQALSVKENDYILAGRVIGASNLRIMLRHIFPNAFPPILIMVTIELGGVILAESSLSFLGIGIAPPIPSWGGMVNGGRRYLLDQPVIAIAPGIAIMMIVFGFNMVGDGLRDALDPRLKGTL